jgi:hypothetical protein
VLKLFAVSGFEHKLPSYLSRMELNLVGEVKQKGSYPNQRVDHVIQELQREL